GEGLDIVTPPFSAVGIMPGNIQVQIDFNSGASFTRTVALVPTGQTFTSYGIANMDGSDNVTHNLNGMTVSLYNTPYSTLFINQHGYIGFGNAAQNYNESLTSFFAGIPALTGGGTSGPSVAVAWSDLGSTSNTSALYEVTEDMVLGTVRVDYKNQDHWPTSNPAGDFSVTFGSLGPNSLTFDHTGFIPDPATSNTHDFVIGITDGDNTVGTDTNFSDGLGGGLAAAIGGSYITPGTVTPPESFAELVPQGVNPGLGIWTALDIGSVGTTPYGTWSLF
ncbi:MAG: hypothetical protein R3F20_17465, partial [Planctomycetota bacterium]